MFPISFTRPQHCSIMAGRTSTRTDQQPAHNFNPAAHGNIKEGVWKVPRAQHTVPPSQRVPLGFPINFTRPQHCSIMAGRISTTDIVCPLRSDQQPTHDFDPAAHGNIKGGVWKVSRAQHTIPSSQRVPVSFTRPQHCSTMAGRTSTRTDQQPTHDFDPAAHGNIKELDQEVSRAQRTVPPLTLRVKKSIKSRSTK